MASDIRDRIINASWELFKEKGYGDTTINDIIEKAGISKGSFYYYFRSKDDMLNTLADVLDDEYKKLAMDEDPNMDAYEKLIYINEVMHTFINDNIDYRLIAYLYSSQIIRDDASSLLNRNRFYFRYLEQIMEEGRREGVLTDTLSVSEMIRYYSLAERALVTDWCMNNGDYHLGEYSKKIFPMLIKGLKKDN